MLVRCLTLALVASAAIAARCPNAAAQNHELGSPRSMALSGSAIADPEDAWSPNPIITFDSAQHYFKRRLETEFLPLPNGMSSAWDAGIGGSIAIDSHYVIGASFDRYQYADIFAAQYLSLQASRTVAIGEERQVAFGLRFRYSQESFGEEYLPIKEMTADLGVSMEFNSEVKIGAAVSHLFSVFRNQDVPTEHAELWLGGSYTPIESLALHAACEAMPDQDDRWLDATLRVGIEYALDPRLMLRVGTETATGSLSAGIGLEVNSLSADFAAVNHPELGFSFAFGLGYSF